MTLTVTKITIRIEHNEESLPCPAVDGTWEDFDFELSLERYLNLVADVLAKRWGCVIDIAPGADQIIINHDGDPDMEFYIREAIEDLMQSVACESSSWVI